MRIVPEKPGDGTIAAYDVIIRCLKAESAPAALAASMRPAASHDEQRTALPVRLQIALERGFPPYPTFCGSAPVLFAAHRPQAGFPAALYKGTSEQFVCGWAADLIPNPRGSKNGKSIQDSTVF